LSRDGLPWKGTLVPRVLLQLLAIVVFAFTLYFVWDFSQRVVTSIRLTQSEHALEQEVASAQATQTALFDKKKLVQSPQYVETVVRGWHWAKDGETVVITQITPAPTPVMVLPQPAPAPEIPWWQQILNFLFGS
jgi:hypothetical protein